MNSDDLTKLPIRLLLKEVGTLWMECVKEMEAHPELEDKFLEILKTGLHSLATELIESGNSKDNAGNSEKDSGTH